MTLKKRSELDSPQESSYLGLSYLPNVGPFAPGTAVCTPYTKAHKRSPAPEETFSPEQR